MVVSTEQGLENFFGGMEVLEPVEFSGLQVFGLRRLRSSSNLSYLTMDDALAEQLLEVSEISEQGSVPDLKVKNRSDSQVFLMAGEQLIGAKQNRVLNVSLMVDANKELKVPVSCVEAGRWGYHSRKFSSSRTSSHSTLRAMMSQQILEAYQSSGRPSSKQGKVWEEISSKLARMKSSSGTEALNQVYQDYESRLREILDRFPHPAGCVGAVFAIDGRIAGMDLFDQSLTLEKLWPKLIRAYAIDALEESQKAAPLGREDVESWLETASRTLRLEEHNSPGLGSDVRLEGNNLVGGCLVVNDQPVHTELFSTS